MNLNKPKPIRENPRELRLLREVAEVALERFNRGSIAGFVIAAQRTIVSDEYEFQDSELDEDDVNVGWDIRLLDVPIGGGDDDVIDPEHSLDISWGPETFTQVSDVLKFTDRATITADEIVEMIIEVWCSRNDLIEVRSGAYLNRTLAESKQQAREAAKTKQAA